MLKTRPASATESAALAQALEASGLARVTSSTIVIRSSQSRRRRGFRYGPHPHREAGTTSTAYFFTFDGLNRFVKGSSSLDAVGAVVIARNFEEFTTKTVGFITWQDPSSDVAEPRSDEDIDPRRVVYGLEVRGCALDLRELYKHGEPSCAHGS